MKKVVPWQRLIDTIEPSYPKGLRGRPPIGRERMLRLYFLQQWYGLADEALEDSLYDSAALRAFAGVDLAVEAVPDATALMKFRHRLEKHELTRKLFDEIGIMLCERGLRFLHKHAEPVTAWCEALGQCKHRSISVLGPARESGICQYECGEGLGTSGNDQHTEPDLTIVAAHTSNILQDGKRKRLEEGRRTRPRGCAQRPTISV